MGAAEHQKKKRKTVQVLCASDLDYAFICGERPAPSLHQTKGTRTLSAAFTEKQKPFCSVVMGAVLHLLGSPHPLPTQFSHSSTGVPNKNLGRTKKLRVRKQRQVRPVEKSSVRLRFERKGRLIKCSQRMVAEWACIWWFVGPLASIFMVSSNLRADRFS